MVEDSQSCNCAAQSPAPPIYYHDSMAVWDLMSTPPDNHMACWDSSSMTAHARPWNSISNLLPDMPGGFVQLYIGHWGVVTDWEGQALLANLGYLRYVNDCYQETVFSDHITYGVTTLHTETDYRKLPKFFEDTTATVEAKLLMDFIDSVSDQNLLYHPNDWLYQPSHPMTTKNLSILVSGHGYSSLIWTASGSGSEH